MIWSMAELLNTFFASVFIAKTSPQESQTLEMRGSPEKGGLSLGQRGLGQKSSKQT